MSTKSDRRRQVVGVDGSPGSKHALAWAVARADHLGPVEPVSAWHYPWWAFVPTGTNALVPLNEKEFDNVARRLVDQSLEGIDRRQVLDAYVSHGSAGDALVQAGETASLIVVGTRGHGSLTGSLLGSVSRHCVNHATVPVAVIPSESPVDDRFGAVVVGYDRSENAERAIEWAIENSPPATEIRVVHVWSPSSTATAQTAAMAFDLLSAESLDLVR
ncbi:MAG: universal stress protein, partial [Acidimicrobiia bacterium]|nr:universal stress protein [Acidimicrobiia bacterium]